MKLYQGNTYRLPIKLICEGVVITPSMVNKIEFSIGTLKKYYPNDVNYENENYIILLSQQDTFSLLYNTEFQARVLLKDNSVKCTPITRLIVKDVLSKEILTNE